MSAPAEARPEIGRMWEGDRIELSHGDFGRVVELRVQKSHMNRDALIKSLHERAGAYGALLNFAGITAAVSFVEIATAIIASDGAGGAAAVGSLVADTLGFAYFANRQKDSSARARNLSELDQLPVISVAPQALPGKK